MKIKRFGTAKILFFISIMPLLTISCGPGHDIILISVDTLRSDQLGCYGNSSVYSPALDEFSRNAVLFQTTIVQAPWTLASHAGMLTSQYPITHKANITDSRLSEDALTLAEHLKSHGYTTIAVVSNPYLNPRFGFNQGFDYYADMGKLDGSHAFERVISVIKEKKEAGALFVFFHLNDPHMPYSAPSPYAKAHDPQYDGNIDGSVETIIRYMSTPMEHRDLNHLLNLYRDEITFSDAQISRFLYALNNFNILKDALIVITSDHGEEFKEHGLLEHNQKLYDESLLAPLIVKFPDSLPRESKSKIFEAQVKSIDIFPTVLDALNIPWPDEAEIQGISLFPYIQKAGRVKVIPENEYVISESANSECISFRSKDLKFIFDRRSGKKELYDLRNDPLETINIADDRGDIVNELQRRAEQYFLKNSSGWHIRNRFPFECSLEITTDGRFVEISAYSLESKDSMTVSRDKRRINCSFRNLSRRYDLFDGADFKTEPEDASIRIDLKTERENAEKSIFIGKEYISPTDVVFEVSPSGSPDPKTSVNDRIMINDDKRSKKGGVYIWRTLSEKQYERADIDVGLQERLKALGYFSRRNED